MPWNMGPTIGCRRRAFRDCSRFMGCLGIEPMAGKAWDRGGLGRNVCIYVAYACLCVCYSALLLTAAGGMELQQPCHYWIHLCSWASSAHL